MSKMQAGKHRPPTRQTRKGIISVRVETDSVTDQNGAEIAEETIDQGASATDEPQAAGDAHDTSETKDVPESGEASSEEEDTEAEDAKDVKFPVRKRRIKWSRVLVFGVLPVLALLIAAAVGFLKWQDARIHSSGAASIESVAAAKESTVALLSYQPDSVEKDLGSARNRLTGTFKDSYTQLVHDVVIPGAKKDHVSAIATVPAAASVSATPNHAVALVFVNQTVTVGNDAPTDTASTVRVTLDKSGDRWLISAFDPV